jgi:NADH-quinone oxidoreductase subunit C
MNKLAERLAGRYDAADWHDQRTNLASVCVPALRVRDVMAWLRDEEGYRHLSFITAIDNIERGVFTLTYTVRNHDVGHSLMVHADISREHPVVDSIHLLWEQAWTYQRELKEWFGIDCPGSPRKDEEFVLEGWDQLPMMRRDFDTLAYSNATFAERPGRISHDPAEYMKQQLYAEDDR